MTISVGKTFPHFLKSSMMSLSDVLEYSKTKHMFIAFCKQKYQKVTQIQKRSTYRIQLLLFVVRFAIFFFPFAFLAEVPEQPYHILVRHGQVILQLVLKMRGLLGPIS